MIFKLPQELKDRKAEAQRIWTKLLWMDHLGQQEIDYALVKHVDCNPDGDALRVTVVSGPEPADVEKILLRTPFKGYKAMVSGK